MRFLKVFCAWVLMSGPLFGIGVDDLLGVWRAQGGKQVLEFYVEGGRSYVLKYDFSRSVDAELDVLSEAQLENYTKMLVGAAGYEHEERPKGGGTYLENFEVLVGIFREHYPFFKQRGVEFDNWVRLYRSQLGGIETDEAFFDFIATFLGELKDNHVAFAESLDGSGRTYFPFNIRSGGFLSGLRRSCGDGDLADCFELLSQDAVGVIEERYLEEVETVCEGMLMWGKVIGGDGDVYLLVRAMEGCEVEVVSAAMDRFVDYIEAMGAKRVIVDVRFNQGGDDAIGAVIASRFVEGGVGYTREIYYGGGQRSYFPEKPLSKVSRRVNERLPVVVLVSPSTASAAETFVLSMRQRSGLRLVGEATMGIFSNQLPRRLPNGWWVLLSSEVIRDKAGESYEVIGVPVDFYAKFPERVDIDAGVDSGLEASVGSKQKQEL